MTRAMIREAVMAQGGAMAGEFMEDGVHGDRRKVLLYHTGTTAVVIEQTQSQTMAPGGFIILDWWEE